MGATDGAAAWEALIPALRAHDDPAVAALVSATVGWVGVNGSRVDARVRDEHGLEHHVVAQRDGKVMQVVAAFHEPPDLPETRGVVVVVNGPAGAGKSLLLAAIARLDRHAWVVLDEPVIGAVDPPLLLWPDRAPALHRGFLDALAVLARAGVRVGVSAGGRSYDDVRGALSGVTTITVGLHCAADVLAARERQRPDRWGGLAEQSAGIHEGWTYDVELDTTEAPPVDDLAAMVLQVVEDAVKRGAGR